MKNHLKNIRSPLVPISFPPGQILLFILYFHRGLKKNNKVEKDMNNSNDANFFVSSNGHFSFDYNDKKKPVANIVQQNKDFPYQEWQVHKPRMLSPYQKFSSQNKHKQKRIQQIISHIDEHQTQCEQPKNYGLNISRISPTRKDKYSIIFNQYTKDSNPQFENKIIQMKTLLNQYSLQNQQNLLIKKYYKKADKRKIAKKNSTSQPIQKGDCKANTGIIFQMENKKGNPQNKLKQMFSNLFEIAASNQLFINPQSHHTLKHKAYIAKGNNGQIVIQVLSKRWWWKIISKTQYQEDGCQLLWTQNRNKTFTSHQESNLPINQQFFLDSKIYDQQEKKFVIEKAFIQAHLEQINNDFTVINDQNYLMVHNHLSQNDQLGNKKSLFHNMQMYYNKRQLNIFDYLPLTYHISSDTDKDRLLSDKATLENQIWIVKPGENSNRGRGIILCRDLEKLEEFKQNLNSSKQTLIIQKYLQEPLLYKKRKFDIRCYMMISSLNKCLKAYWQEVAYFISLRYQEGYVRTSSVSFNCEDLTNLFIHLTNDAIQQHGAEYGKYEPCNKLSFQELNAYMSELSSKSNILFQDILPQMEVLFIQFNIQKNMARQVLEATYQIIDKDNTQNNFEIFGLDFMIDKNFRVWLIEVNTNPCLETGCSLLSCLIPNMLDEAFKICLDPLFPPPVNWPLQRYIQLADQSKPNKFKLIFDEYNRQE